MIMTLCCQNRADGKVSAALRVCTARKAQRRILATDYVRSTFLSNNYVPNEFQRFV